MGMAFYELSDGADFEPETRDAKIASIDTTQLEPVPFDQPVVTRAAAIELPALTANDIENISADIVQASLSTPAAPTEAIPETPALDMRAVAGKRVNMRSGPGTNYSVLDTLPRGTEAEVLTVNADGWAEIRITRTGQIGWMAERLLTDG